MKRLACVVASAAAADPEAVLPFPTPKLADIVDPPALQSLVDDLYGLIGVPMAIIDLDGRVLVGAGWQDICADFHRRNPRSCQACLQSDLELTAGIAVGEFRVYRCKNNMWDVATPIVVRDRPVGNVFSGQFFFDDEVVDYEVFRRQAQRYGFDQRDYLAALDRVPRLSRALVDRALACFVKLAQMVSRLGDANVTLARTVAERDELMAALERGEAELRTANARLAEADRRKDEFIAILSHELRNPLAPIRCALPLLGRDRTGETADRTMAVLERQVGQLSRLVDDLLDVSRVRLGQIQLRREWVTLGAVVSTAVETASPAVAAKHQTLAVALADGSARIHVDPARLIHVLSALLDNASKYTPRGGHLGIDAVVDATEVAIRVRDTGIGLSEESLPTLFEMFRHAPCRDDAQGGLGVGLALAKRLVDLHGGSIEAHSAGTGLGAEFVVRLPAAGEEAERPELSRSGPALARRKLKVLVVDDNEDLVEMLALVVTAAGHDVRKAFDGPAAISAALSYQPEVVLLDLGLPFLSGIEVARELRRQPETAGARLVALTGWGQAEDREETQQVGFDHHLTKPADPRTLTQMLAAFAAEVA